MYIAVDFDGTCVTDEYPGIGRDIGAVPVLKELVEEHSLILWTMRSGAELDAAVRWFRDRDIPLYGINENPSQRSWTSSPKAYAHVVIDDIALGCPLASVDGERPYVDWKKVREELKRRGVL